MIQENEILKILNHNGGSRRYSKSEGIQVYIFLKLIAESHVKQRLSPQIAAIKNNRNSSLKTN